MSDLVFLCAVCLYISLCLMFYNNVKKMCNSRSTSRQMVPQRTCTFYLVSVDSLIWVIYSSGYLCAFTGGSLFMWHLWPVTPCMRSAVTQWQARVGIGVCVCTQGRARGQEHHLTLLSCAWPSPNLKSLPPPRVIGPENPEEISVLIYRSYWLTRH